MPTSTSLLNPADAGSGAGIAPLYCAAAIPGARHPATITRVLSAFLASMSVPPLLRRRSLTSQVSAGRAVGAVHLRVAVQAAAIHHLELAGDERACRAAGP